MNDVFMSKKEELAVKVFVFIFIILVFVLIPTFFFQVGKKSANADLLEDCQKTLPRNQHCILKAVPENVE